MAKFLQMLHEIDYIDVRTGEVTNNKISKIYKAPINQEKFFKLFVNNVGLLYGIRSASTYQVLLWILQNGVNRGNDFMAFHGMIARACDELGIHRNTIREAIKELKALEILIPRDDGNKSGSKKVDEKFVLNPYIFGQGSFIDIANLRQSIEYFYDFEQCTITKTLSSDSVTKFGKKILENPQNYEVVDYKHEQNGNYRNLELSVREKDFYDVEANDVEQDKLLQNKSNNITNYRNEEDSLLSNQKQGDRDEENQKLNKILEKKEFIEKEIEEFNVMENELSIKIESLKLEVLKEKNRARELELEVLKEKNRARELELKIQGA